MEWFKLYHEARRDKKLSILTLAERGVWVNLLCYASEQTERGAFDASDRFTLALECADGDEDTLNSAIEKLLKVRCLITVDGAPDLLVFRMFTERQTRKASNFPSDAPERILERVNKHRSKGKVTADNDPVTSVTSRNDTEEDVDVDEERDTEGDILSSGNILSPDDDVVVHTSTASGAQSAWTSTELRQVGKRIIGRMKLPPSALDGLILILQQYPHAPPWLESEAGLCAEWCAKKHKKPSLSIFNNWMKRDVTQQQAMTLAAQSMNGHTPGTEAGTNGTTESTRRTAAEREAALEEQRAQQSAELVRELAKLRPGG